MADVIEKISLKSDLDEEAKRAKLRFFSSCCKYIKTLSLLRRQLPKERLIQLSHKVATKIIRPILQPDDSDAELVKEMEGMLSVFQK